MWQQLQRSRPRASAGKHRVRQKKGVASTARHAGPRGSRRVEGGQQGAGRRRPQTAVWQWLQRVHSSGGAGLAEGQSQALTGWARVHPRAEREGRGMSQSHSDPFPAASHLRLRQDVNLSFHRGGSHQREGSEAQRPPASLLGLHQREPTQPGAPPPTPGSHQSSAPNPGRVTEQVYPSRTEHQLF